MLVFPNREKDKIQMIIIANGNQDFFEKVKEVVNSALQLKDWKFTAFVQPKHEYEELESGLDYLDEINKSSSEEI